VTDRDKIASAFVAACLDELEAPKPGNVHVYAPGRKPVDLFRRSAEVCAPRLATPGARVGKRILDAVDATVAEVGTNTNLGIVLLCAPLAAAAENAACGLRAAVAGVLDGLDLEDAALAFRAIARAAPGGLGNAARHDVRDAPTVSLRDAMAEAAGRDRIAHQYVTGFADVFAAGEPALEAGLMQWSDPKWATLVVFLQFMSAFDDSHVVREHGTAAGDELRRDATSMLQRFSHAADPAAFLPELMEWDRSLKSRGINPGTSADLTVATLFVRRLRTILPSTRNNG
jgi:triphosphoribosyl-dephospho-CoA synthase